MPLIRQQLQTIVTILLKKNTPLYYYIYFYFLPSSYLILLYIATPSLLEGTNIFMNVILVRVKLKVVDNAVSLLLYLIGIITHRFCCFLFIYLHNTTQFVIEDIWSRYRSNHHNRLHHNLYCLPHIRLRLYMSLRTSYHLNKKRYLVYNAYRNLSIVEPLTVASASLEEYCFEEHVLRSSHLDMPLSF